MSAQILPEDLSRDELTARQWDRLTGMLRELSTNPFWTRRFEEQDVKPEEIRTWDDFRQLRPLTKQELVDDQMENLPYGTNLTYPRSRYLRLHQTSGTTGRPMRFLDTRESWDWWKECWAQIYRVIGLREDDRLCFPFSFGPFIGFWAGFEGALQFDNLCIAAGGMSSEIRLRVILEHEITIVCCTPTYALRLIEVAEREGIDLTKTQVRGIVVAGEPGGSIPAIRKRIEEGWDARVFDHWGMTDIGALGVEAEADPASLLLLESECIAEIVDPETLKPVEPGTRGELLITNLGRWGTPVIRYRTGDIVQAATTPNACGRSLMRLEGGILGRADDMITIRGNNVFPSSVEAVLREFPEIAEYRITVTEKEAMHHMVIEIEPILEESESWPSAIGAERLQGFLARLHRAVRDRLHFQAEINFVDPDSLPRFEMKGRRFHRK